MPRVVSPTQSMSPTPHYSAPVPVVFWDNSSTCTLVHRTPTHPQSTHRHPTPCHHPISTTLTRQMRAVPTTGAEGSEFHGRQGASSRTCSALDTS
eukprot:768016-Hanusia_phi.AAC.4